MKWMEYELGDCWDTSVSTHLNEHVCLSLCLFLSQSVCLSVSQSVCRSIDRSVGLSVFGLPLSFCSSFFQVGRGERKHIFFSEKRSKFDVQLCKACLPWDLGCSESLWPLAGTPIRVHARAAHNAPLRREREVRAESCAASVRDVLSPATASARRSQREKPPDSSQGAT